jgi:hypothetical protein
VNFLQDEPRGSGLSSQSMAQTFDLSATFVHLRDGGGAESVNVTPAFWSGDAGKSYDRLVGAFDFRSSADLHSSMQEMHPAADEVLYVVSGAIDVVLEEGGTEQTLTLVMRQPGRLVFINSRTNMQARRRRG